MSDVGENYVPAFWYAMGKSDDNLSIAADFANHFAIERMGSSCHTGIPKSFEKWEMSR